MHLLSVLVDILLNNLGLKHVEMNLIILLCVPFLYEYR